MTPGPGLELIQAIRTNGSVSLLNVTAIPTNPGLSKSGSTADSVFRSAAY